MMNLRPYYSETIVLAFTTDEVEFLFRDATEASREPKVEEKKSKREKLFNGIVKNQHLSISRKIDSPENFLPIIKGSIEATTQGSILFLEYRLFFSTLLFLSFWTFICLVSGSILFFLGENNPIGLYLLLFGLAQYILCMFFFYRQVEKSRDVIYQLLQTKKMPL
jgi:hypothetical protein